MDKHSSAVRNVTTPESEDGGRCSKSTSSSSARACTAAGAGSVPGAACDVERICICIPHLFGTKFFFYKYFARQSMCDLLLAMQSSSGASSSSAPRRAGDRAHGSKHCAAADGASSTVPPPPRGLPSRAPPSVPQTAKCIPHRHTKHHAGGGRPPSHL